METIKGILQQEMELLKKNIQSRMIEERINASGRTMKSLTVQTSEFGGILFGSSVFLNLQRGRKPGAVPRNFVEIIKNWIEAKGINYSDYTPKSGAKLSSEMKLQSLAGAIAHTIMKKGTVLHRKGVTKDIYSKALQETLGNIGDRVGEKLALEIDTINNKFKSNENSN